MRNFQIFFILLLLPFFILTGCDDGTDNNNNNPVKPTYDLQGTISNFTEEITIYLCSADINKNLNGDRREVKTSIDPDNKTQSIFHFDDLTKNRVYVLTPVYRGNTEFGISLSSGGTENNWGYYPFYFKGDPINLQLTPHDPSYNYTQNTGKMDDFTLNDQNGNSWTMWDQHNKVTVLILSTDWCPYTPLAEAEREYQRFKNQNIQFVAIFNDRQKGIEKANLAGVTFPVLGGTSQEFDAIWQKYNPYYGDTFPLILIIDKNCNRVYEALGAYAIGASLRAKLNWHR